MIRRFALLFLLPLAGFAASEPALFSRSQLKYGLERDDYLGRWVDRPLFVDPSIGPRPAGTSIHPESYRRMRETARQYGLDGFAFFPEVRRTQEIYDLTDKDSGFLLLSEFGSRGTDTEKAAIAKIALEHPSSFRLDGKVVFTSYGADRLSPARWQTSLQKIRQQHGDHFLFLPAVNQLGGQSLAYWMERFDADALTPENWEAVKATLREWLRATDGLYFASTAGLKKKRLFHAEFYRDFVIRAMRETLAEPEFKGKYLGLSANIGHENSTRFGYTQSSDGTRTLRHSLEAALAAKPQLINIPEWDEQNENTSLRPTVYNGRSSQRILRHYAAQRDNQLAEPLAGDDVSLPNLILSYRKVLTLGEALEVELLNVPDAAAEGSYHVKVRLLDPKGVEVAASPEYTFEARQLKEERFTLPSERFPGHEVLEPVVEITRNGAEPQHFAQGWHPIVLRPTWNWDYKWVKQPLRDVLLPSRARFTLSPPGANGLRTAQVEFEAGEPLAYLELLDNDDVVYSHAAAPAELWRETPGQVVIALSWQAAKTQTLPGRIALRNAPNARWRLPEEARDALTDGAISTGALRTNTWPRQALVALSREEAREAVFEIDIPGVYQGALPVARILEENIHGLPGNGGLNMVFSRYLRQPALPSPLGVRQVAFEAEVLPDLPRSVLLLQAIGQSGRIYRSKAIVASNDDAERGVVVFSDTERRPVTLAEAAAPTIRYPFEPTRGSILHTPAGRPFWGILGGFSNQATGRGGGESRDGTPFIKSGDYPESAPHTAPKWVSLPEGGHALEFDGQGTFVTLPQGVIPRRAGFTVRMEVYPEAEKGRQVLLANASYYPGSLVLYLENGVPKARFAGEAGAARGLSAGAPLKPEQWSVLEVVCDQSHLWFIINGEASQKFPIPGPGLYDTPTVLGGFGTEWFRGKIRALEVRHQPML